MRRKYQINKQINEYSNKRMEGKKLDYWFIRLLDYSRLKIPALQVGFTLIEFLVYMGIFSILLVSLFQILTSVLDTQAESQATSSVDEDGKFILSRLSYDIQRASAIVTPASIGGQSSTLQLTIGGVSYTYSLNSNNLVLTNNLETNALLNGYDTTISNITFTKLGNANGKNVISAAFTLTSKTTRTSGPEVRTFTTTIGTR